MPGYVLYRPVDAMEREILSQEMQSASLDLPAPTRPRQYIVGGLQLTRGVEKRRTGRNELWSLLESWSQALETGSI